MIIMKNFALGEYECVFNHHQKEQEWEKKSVYDFQFQLIISEE